MAVPKKKVSISKKKNRHSVWQTNSIKKLLNKATTVKCDNCDTLKLSHRVCPHCGFYAGKQILTIKTKSKETIIEE
ncbi:50S ribosomal protein L32 [Candidatus Vampirococcus lugosii]|uniref:Large ribosomal subunit protein bL32 n=1 Tax=Candidatus Vampirococcus lugosii TaxID=2789015 RepID=A0ABS5QPH8_9BACT|nr:Ribosomal protein L32 [Candidatus Vampirococcus lugosii]